MAAPEKSMRSTLGRARGLGSAKDGTAHWWGQRTTAVALVPLVVWFVVGVVTHAGAPLAEVKAWLGSPVCAVLMVALVVATFQHGRLGLQVVVEDYIHIEGLKVALLLAINGASLLFGGFAVFSILKLAFGG
jgi:succinate dehydrogenase / fumarate reductase membrane anchor subunit